MDGVLQGSIPSTETTVSARLSFSKADFGAVAAKVRFVRIAAVHSKDTPRPSPRSEPACPPSRRVIAAFLIQNRPQFRHVPIPLLWVRLQFLRGFFGDLV